MHLAVTIAAASYLAVAQAHVAMWNKGMFGYNYPNQAGDKVQNWNTNEPVVPLRESDGFSVDQWFGHGYKSFPPLEGDFMDLPSGGTYMGELACNRADSRMRDPSRTDAQPQYACGGEGALHTVNKFGQPVDNKWFGGSSIGIAYTSDINSVQPNDMTIISVNHASPWLRETPYQIPAGMPPCPAGGCICSWNWLHRAGNGEGYPYEMYNLLYRCRITGNTDSSKVVQRGAVAKNCAGNPSACVRGPKTGLYIYQRTGNNLPRMENPPTYTDEWGFADGAQNDIFTAAVTPAGTTGIANPYATPTGTQTFENPAPTATALPSGWTALGCTVDQPSPRYLSNNVYNDDSNSISMCVNKCEELGYTSASVQYGKECWCGNTTVAATPATDKECDVRCPGDVWAFCGGSYKANLFRKELPKPVTTTSAAPTTTSANATTSAVSSTTTVGVTTSANTTTVATTPTATSVNSTTVAPTTTGTSVNSTTVVPTTAAPITANVTTAAPTSANTTAVAATTFSSSSSSVTTISSSSSTTTGAVTTTSSTTTSAPSPSSTIPAGWSALGCHTDNASRRSLNGTMFSNYRMSAQECVSRCATMGFNYAGTQYGTQCYCGNTFTPTNSTGCNTPCAGDKDQICGGPWRNSVYVNNAILESTSTSSSSSASSTGTASSSSSSSTTSSSTTAQAASTTSASSSATTTSSTTGTSSPTGSVVTVTVTHTVTETSCPTAHMARRRILYH